jgi:hypothetical protein
MDVLKIRGSWCKSLSMLLYFVVFFYFFFIFYCKTDKTHYSVKKCVFFSFSSGIRGFFILTRDLEKKRLRKVFQFSSRKNPRGVTTV